MTTRDPPTLVYLHGFNSSPQSVKGRLLARAASALPHPPRLHVPALPPRAANAMQIVVQWVDAHVLAGDALTFIGSSLGGFYATWLAERYGARAVVINPAIRPNASLESFLGPQRNLYTGEAYELTRADLDDMTALRVPRIAFRSATCCSCAAVTSSWTGARRYAITPARGNTSAEEAITGGATSSR